MYDLLKFLNLCQCLKKINMEHSFHIEICNFKKYNYFIELGFLNAQVFGYYYFVSLYLDIKGHNPPLAIELWHHFKLFIYMHIFMNLMMLTLFTNSCKLKTQTF